MIGIAGPLAPCVASQDVPAAAAAADMSGLHDFDFLVGEWRVHSRRLKEALADSHEWYEFDGTIRSQPLMDGRANVDDTVFNLPTGIYRGVAPRAYDPQTGQWAIWWIDGRNPFGNLDPPVKRPLRRRSRHVLRERHAARKTDQGTLHLVEDHENDSGVGAGVLARRRQNLGNELAAEAGADALRLLEAEPTP